LRGTCRARGSGGPCGGRIGLKHTTSRQEAGLRKRAGRIDQSLVYHWRMSEFASDNLREEIVLLEAQIEALADKIESCRKFILAARVAVVSGGVVLVAILLGAINFDPRALLAACAGVLGGIVVWGSNASTAKQAAAQLAQAEVQRTALIERLDLQVVAERPTLH
jgi:hypothetical protein